MRLALCIGYWSPQSTFADDVRLTVAAEEAGYDSVWTAESYGSDSVTPLAYLAARTERIGLGAGVMQIPGRSAAMTAMTAATLDTMSGGRFRLGLGVSGPQVSEGWHGVRFTGPLGRTREYVDVVRTALRREDVRYEGKHITLPLPDGPGKALRLNFRPARPEIPVYLAAVGPKNLELAGEIADGWLGIFVSPEQAGAQIDSLRAGARRAGRGTPEDPLAGFDVLPTVPLSVDDDLEAAADRVRPYTALYVGGMGSREQNFYYRTACALGYEAEAEQIQEHFLARRHREAAAAVPTALIDETALIGSPDRIRDRLSRYSDASVTTVGVSPYAETTERREEAVRTIADLL